MGIPLYPVPGKHLELRIGVVLDEWLTPAWITHVLGQVAALEGVRIAAVILDRDCRYAFRATAPRARLFDAYERRDAARLRSERSPFAPEDARPLLEGAETIELRCRTTDGARELDPDVSAAIGACGLDVILHLGVQPPPFGLRALARLGVWVCHFGDSRVYRGDPPLYWEIHDRDPLSTTELHVLRADPERSDVVIRSVGATHFLSLELNRHPTYWKAASFMPRLLRRLSSMGETALVGEPLGALVATRVKPSGIQMLAFLARMLPRRISAALRRRGYEEHWIVGFRYADALLDPARPRLDSMQVLPCPRGHFYADPCALNHGGRDFVFVEDFDYASGLGSIACVEMTPAGPVGPTRTVLAADTHLSYPQVFAWRDGIYMLPEAGAARVVRLYRAVEFPWRWEPVADLLSGYHAADATLVHHDDHWYMFTVIPESGGGIHEELFLFHAPDLLGPWLPHPANPVVSDVRCARPAGPVFHRGGRLVRPAQDCSINYGRDVVFNEILELTPDTYRERPLGRLDRDWHPRLHGCHTYCASGRLEVVDGKFHARKADVRAPEGR